MSACDKKRPVKVTHCMLTTSTLSHVRYDYRSTQRVLVTQLVTQHATIIVLSLVDHSYTIIKLSRQGVALTGRNPTGPPCSVGRPTVQAPGDSVTDDDRRQREKQYWPTGRASNNATIAVCITPAWAGLKMEAAMASARR